MLKKKSSKKSFISNYIIVLIQLLCNICLGIVIQIIVAAKFGATAEKDAYDTAFLIPSVIMYFTGLDIIRQTGTTLFSRLVTEDNTNLSIIFSSIFLIVFLFSIIISVLISVSSSTLVSLAAPGLDNHHHLLAEQLLVILSFTLTPLSLGGYLASVQNAFYFFGSAEAGQLVSKIIPIFGLVFIQSTSIEYYAWYVFFGAYLGTFIQYLLFKRTKLCFYFIIDFKNRHFRDFFHQGRYLMVGMISTQLVRLYINNLASQSGEGIIAILNYSLTVLFVFVALIGRPLGRVIGPFLIRSLAYDNKIKVADQTYGALKFIIWLCTPFILFTIIFRLPIIKCLFEHGEFGISAVNITADFFYVLAFSILTQNISSLLSFVLLTKPRSMAMGAMHFTGAFLHGFVAFLGLRTIGIIGLPLSFLITSIFKSLFILYYLIFVLGIRPSFSIVNWILNQSFVLLVLSICLIFFRQYFMINGTIFQGELVLLICGAVISVALYGILGVVTKTPETIQIIKYLKNFINKFILLWE